MRQPTKAHTHQPAQQHAPLHPGLEQGGIVIGLVLGPFVIAALAFIAWRMVRARMGYRSVRYDA